MTISYLYLKNSIIKLKVIFVVEKVVPMCLFFFQDKFERTFEMEEKE